MLLISINLSQTYGIKIKIPFCLRPFTIYISQAELLNQMKNNSTNNEKFKHLVKQTKIQF